MDFLFSTPAIIYYFLVLGVEIITRYGYIQLEETGKKNLLNLGLLISFGAFAILLYTCYVFHWWAFPALLALNTLINNLAIKIGSSVSRFYCRFRSSHILSVKFQQKYLIKKEPVKPRDAVSGKLSYLD
jgi:hypothetical protein